MNKLINWLRANPLYNFLILALYYLLVVLPHEQIGIQIAKLDVKYGRDTYNMILLSIALTVLLAYVIPLIRNILKGTNQKQQWFYLLLTLLLTIYTVNCLFVVNAEVVHFVQYAVFAILCYPFVENYSLTLIWVLMMGWIDEAYQYFYLAPDRTDYYDWNDVVTDFIGGAFGLVFLRSFEIKGKYLDFKGIIRSKTFLFLLGMVILFVFLLNTSYLDWYPMEGIDATYYMVRKVPEGWWSVVHPDVTYHVMQPLEGIVAAIGLCFLYRHIGR